ncbi:MAG: urease accessory protein UreD [Verrucomicrobiota bacterium]
MLDTYTRSNMQPASTTGPQPAPAGSAELEVQLVFGESTLVSARAASPMKLLTPNPRGASVWTYSSSFGGGLVAGDQTALAITVGPGARCFFGTQASTKVYRNPGAAPCHHKTTASLGAGSLLVFAPDPVQAYADSHYTQTQEFRLAAGSGLVLLDWFGSGRAARGERWAFQHFQSRNEVFIDGRRAFIDSLLLDPADGPVASEHRGGRFNCHALLLLLGAPLAGAAAQLLQLMHQAPVQPGESPAASASAVPDGALLRVAGESVEQVGALLRGHLGFLPGLLGDDPWSRKHF